jgi:hypothetical protein
MRVLIKLAGCIAAVLIVSSAVRRARAYDPTSAYEQRTVQGFPVLVSREALKHPRELDAAITELDAQLGRVIDVVGAEPLAALRRIRIWVEWRSPRNVTAEFHPSRAWLKENGYNPDKAGCVEIGDITRFVAWSRGEQPWMVMHELAHGFHFTVLGPDHEGIRAAYKQAVADGRYKSVDYVRGGPKQKAYALGDEKEYFAELTEAYLGKNDFYPFTREDLKKHDPVGYRLAAEVWGGKATTQPADVR